MGAGGGGDGQRGERASERTQALCGVIRPTFCLANLSYLTSAALEDKQRRARRKRRRRRTPKSWESERVTRCYFLLENEVAFYCASQNIYHARVLLMGPLFGLERRVGTLFESPSHSWQLWRIWSNIIMLLWHRAKRVCGGRFHSSVHTDFTQEIGLIKLFVQTFS